MGVRSTTQSSTQSGNALLTVKVMDIILDLNHEKSEQYGFWDGLGTIFYIRVDAIVGNPNLEKNWKDSKQLRTARPLQANQKYYPLVGEIVMVLSAAGKSVIKPKQDSYYLPNINIWNHPHHNAVPNPLAFKEDGKTKRDYINSTGGLVRHVKDGSTDIDLGKYFKEKLNTKPLLPYEGDYILEGRYGNSIRFGSTIPTEKIDENNANDWSAEGDLGDPITVIRNGQSEELDANGWEPTIEDINRDSTSIYLTSNQQISSLEVSFLKWESWGAEYEPPVDNLQALTSPPVEEIVEEKVVVVESIDEQPNESDPTVFDPPEAEMIEEDESDPPPPEIEEEEEGDELSMYDELIESGDFDEDDFEEGENQDVSGQDIATDVDERIENGEDPEKADEGTSGTDVTSIPVSTGNGTTGGTNWKDNRDMWAQPNRPKLFAKWGYRDWKYPANIIGRYGITTKVPAPAAWSSVANNLGPKANEADKRYLILHCTAGARKPPVESILGMIYGDSGVASLGGGRAGYHIMIQADGKVCKIYDDSFTAYGAGGTFHGEKGY